MRFWRTAISTGVSIRDRVSVAFGTGAAPVGPYDDTQVIFLLCVWNFWFGIATTQSFEAQG